MALKHESESVTVSPVLKQRIDAKRGRGSTFRVRALAVGGVALAVAIAAIAYFASRPQENQGLVASPTPATRSIGTVFHTPEGAFHCFFEAKHYRDFQAAKPCVTTRYAATFSDPVELIGPSSPSMQRATILSSTRTDANETFAVRTYYGTSTGLVSSAEGQLTVVPDASGVWRVDRYMESNNRPVERTMRVQLAFVKPGSDPCNRSFVTLTREVLDEPSTNVVQEHLMTVAQELLTGHWTWEGSVVDPYPLSERVDFVDKNGNNVQYSMHGGSIGGRSTCDAATDALGRTVRALPGLENAQVATTSEVGGP